jgi:hypothetical protein
VPRSVPCCAHQSQSSSLPRPQLCWFSTKKTASGETSLNFLENDLLQKEQAYIPLKFQKKKILKKGFLLKISSFCTFSAHFCLKLWASRNQFFQC